MAYNAKKAAQTIAYFAIKNGSGPLDVLKAVKLVYLADRQSIACYGFPIQDELRVSMPHGPVNSQTYSHINGEQDLAASGWSDYLRDKADHKIALARPDIVEDDLDELSDANLLVLDQVWERFGAMGKWELRDWTHVRENIPEWEDPNGSSSPIPIERIMGYLELPHADEQAQLVAEFDRIDNLFRSL
jgi:uncharacterized phage-associated protein